MNRLIPRSLSNRWAWLIVLVGILTTFLSLGLERLWAILLQTDPLQDARFWLVLMGGIGILLALSISVSRLWLKPLHKLPNQASQICNGSNPYLESSIEEVNAILQAFLAQRQRNETELTELRSFVANASHELRTPLTTLKLRVEALRDGAMDEPPMAKKFLSEMESEIDHLSRLVNDLLDLSRIEAMKDGISRREVDFVRIVSEVCEAFKVRAQRSNINLLTEVENDIPPFMGVEEQLRRLIYNLLDNAIKYTPNGGWVKVRLYQQIPARKLILEVEDNGFGIPSHYLPHIFERFYRAEATRPRYGISRGSGLGLAIVKAIVDAHGGKITAESEVGKGSLFRVELPFCV